MMAMSVMRASRTFSGLSARYFLSSRSRLDPAPGAVRSTIGRQRAVIVASERVRVVDHPLAFVEFVLTLYGSLPGGSENTGSASAIVLVIGNVQLGSDVSDGIRIRSRANGASGALQRRHS